ncbi:hypothetical protein D3Y59_13185 [Hymenobacter oligotrophus]|uniref:Outer membrane protein beta-barrel domain-containing protein n=1 Tax=Hymenobacter oligotrophus TaxID=2319843 RepID=A0A3B7R1E0_9BACT|nr:hypothetical protein [Hymenobacter oligotrophus]AYA37914.1 hypothetical protein D3Y59_13185 [Hymenobacter oligotrophus]
MRSLFLLPLLAALLPAPARAAHLGAAVPDTTAAAAPAADEPAAPLGLVAQPWYRPHHVLVQAAGGQGMVAAGVGYTTLRGKLEVDVLAGYVPKKYSITPMGVFTGKATFSPFALDLGETKWQVRPLSVGMFVTHTASNGMVESRDEKYYKGYYWWSARTRIGGFVGGRVARVIGSNRFGQPRTVAAYYELGTNDLYLTSAMTNLGGLPLHDILTLGFGVKLDL